MSSKRKADADKKVTLKYFDIKGLGEPIRYVLSIAGVPFEDSRFASRDEFLALKPSLRFGQVPCLIVDGKEYFQSAAIMRAVCKIFGCTSLYPDEAEVAADVDAFMAVSYTHLTLPTICSV